MSVDTDIIPTPEGRAPSGRGLEPTGTRFDNPTEAKRMGNGPRPFMSHQGPKAGDSGIDRGQFSVRTKLTSNP